MTVFYISSDPKVKNDLIIEMFSLLNKNESVEFGAWFCSVWFIFNSLLSYLKPNSLLAERQLKKIDERAQRYKSRKESEQKNLGRMCCMQAFPSNLTFLIRYQ